MLELEKELNKSQLEAVTLTDAPLLVIAGAGSGKTRVLTYKVAYLLENGYKPWEILSLTFTNKAAREMNRRIEQLIGEGRTRHIWSGTFHSIFARILRQEAANIGYSPNFTIYDTTDSQSVIRRIVKEMGLDDKTYKPARILSCISEAKSRLVLPDAYAADTAIMRRNAARNISETHRIYKRYNELLQQSDAMDFDDLLLMTFLLFRDHDDIRRKYADRFRYILVDEYQDTNYAQHRIVMQLAPGGCICVVGDDAQSIYSFRGANIGNILSFSDQFKDTKIVKLERNYRSTKNIVRAANSIIAHNKRQIHKDVFSEETEGEKIKVISAYSDKEEAIIVSKFIGNYHLRDHTELNDIAILYRTNAQSRAIEEALRDKNIPYRIYSGLSFYQRKEIKDVIAYLRLIINPHDDEALRRVINYPARGIGSTTLGKLQQAASDNGCSLWEACQHPTEMGADLNKGTLGKLGIFLQLIDDFREKEKTLDIVEATKYVVTTSGIQNDLLTDDDSESKRQNVDELLASIAHFAEERREMSGEESASLSQYLTEVSLLTDTDKTDDGSPKVTLMTVHAAKGLEYDTIFITGMEEGLFPSESHFASSAELEEERRLFYVAVTRAKKRCILTWCKNRFRYGKTEICDPSPFLDEIDASCLDKSSKTEGAGKNVFMNSTGSYGTGSFSIFGTRSSKSNNWHRATGSSSSGGTVPPRSTTGLQRLRKSDDTARNVDSISTPNGIVSVGQRIEHGRFGEGRVKTIEEEGSNSKITVVFDNVGEKKLLIKYAAFRIIG